MRKHKTKQQIMNELIVSEQLYNRLTIINKQHKKVISGELAFLSDKIRRLKRQLNNLENKGCKNELD